MSVTTSTVASSIPVRVVVRVRPLIPLETETGAEECVTVDDKSHSVFVSDRSFCFDSVFGSGCTQDFVYEESVRDLLNSSFSGYNTTIFAYGQTGSGKTYTMGTGVEEDFPALVYPVVASRNLQHEVVEDFPLEIGVGDGVVSEKRVVLVERGHERIHAVVGIRVGLVVKKGIDEVLVIHARHRTVS